MGWASGVGLAEETYALVRKYIPVSKRQKIAEKFYDAFCNHDADDWSGDTQIEKDADINQELEIDE